MRPPKVLTVAGSDSGGGAGIQADVRTISLLGCHATTAITAVTSQNSLGVQAIAPLDVGAVCSQMESVLSDMGVQAAKTGMLFDAAIITAVARILRDYEIKNIVVDPVMVAKGGARLLKDEAQAALVRELLPLALIVTPNIPEAEALTGLAITDLDSARAAARALLKKGPRAVLIKGGHGGGETVTDLYLDAQGGEKILTSARASTRNTHGTGCTLSASLASYLARGEEPVQAVELARDFVKRAIAHSYPTGGGHGSTNPYAAARAGEGEVIERLHLAWELLEEGNPHGLIPEVQSNLAEALPYALSHKDVAAFPGRIVKAGGRIRKVEGPRLAASRHMAKILMASARRGSPFRAVMNIRFGEEVLEAVAACGYTMDGFSRAEEPPEVQEAEGSTLEWGTGQVLDRLGFAPEAIFDRGGDGKEPMVRIFGKDALDVVKKVLAIWRALENETERR